MGFGLHVGWAIEGAIGSSYKIDASYLSPNVNLASRLEAATKQYGVPLLISNALYSHLSKKAKSFVRQIDHVTVKGSRNPIGLFTVDLELEGLGLGSVKIGDKRKKRSDHLMKKSYIFESALVEGFKVGNFFDLEEDLVTMTRHLYGEKFGKFRKTFGEGFEAYEKGEFGKAVELFKEGIRIKGEEDGPSRALINFLEENGERVKKEWKGYRELTEK